MKGEEGQVRGKYIGLMQFFTVEMEDILLLPRVHLGHIVVGAFYLKLVLLNLLTIYYLFEAIIWVESTQSSSTWTKLLKILDKKAGELGWG